MELDLPNEDLANHLREIGGLYKIEGDTYRAKVFNEAAQKIELYPIVITSGQNAKETIRAGIGASIMEVIDQYLTNGTSGRLEQLKQKHNDRVSIINLFMSIHGIGVSIANDLYDKGFRTLDELWYNANLTSAQQLSIYYRDHLIQRITRSEMKQIEASLLGIFPNSEFIIAGSYRRGEPTSGDIDVLFKMKNNIRIDELVYLLKQHKLLVGDLAQGKSKYLGIFQLPGMYAHRIDILLVDPENWGNALMYFTGSQRFNILMRQRAKDLGYRLNEYGLYNIAGTRIITDTEEDIFKLLKVKYMTPEERTRNLPSLDNYFL